MSIDISKNSKTNKNNEEKYEKKNMNINIYSKQKYNEEDE